MEPCNPGGATKPGTLGTPRQERQTEPGSRRTEGNTDLTRGLRFPGPHRPSPCRGQLRKSASSDRLTFRTRVCASFPVAVVKNRPVRVLEDRDKDATVGLLLLGMFEGRRGR
jgi:hypothetical protein